MRNFEKNYASVLFTQLTTGAQTVLESLSVAITIIFLSNQSNQEVIIS